jgi:hypothetical protein
MTSQLENEKKLLKRFGHTERMDGKRIPRKTLEIKCE